MTIHTLKCWPAYWDAINSGAKPFEVRLDDRSFQPGDTLILCRTLESNPDQIDMIGDPPATDQEDTREPRFCLTRQVTYCLHGPKFGLQAGYVIMGLKELDNA